MKQIPKSLPVRLHECINLVIRWLELLARRPWHRRVGLLQPTMQIGQGLNFPVPLSKTIRAAMGFSLRLAAFTWTTDNIIFVNKFTVG